MIPLNHLVAPNATEVAGEVIDGEAIIINLVTGVYHSMDGVGGALWALIEEQRSLEEIVTALVARYDVSREQAEAEVQTVVAALLQQRLVVVSERQAPGSSEEGAAPDRKLPYEPPKLNTYRDMSDLLALDPPAPGLTDIPWRASSDLPG